MELVAYDEKAKTVTVKMTVADLADLHSVALGVLGTKQDYTILGVREPRMREMEEDLMQVLKARRTKPQ